MVDNRIFRLGFYSKALSSAERVGGTEDFPEGARVVQISDTLVNEMSDSMALADKFIRDHMLNHTTDTKEVAHHE